MPNTRQPMKDRVNILMVDDQPAKLLSYEVMLGELDENLIKASSAKEALELLLKNDVAVVLMDVSMPEVDGFELANMIRQHPRFQKTAIIFISAVHLTDVDRLKGYKQGAVDYISVPVIPELLRAKVSVFSELHRKTRQLQTLNRELERRVEERTEELEKRSQTLQQLNRELARKNQELDAIIHTAPDIIFSRQADGSRDYISDRFYDYTGADSGSANGFGWLDYVHPDDKEHAMAHWLGCVESGANYEAEYRIHSRDGAYRWFRARALPIRDPKGEIVKWYGTCSDIHDSKRDLHDGLGQELAVAKMVLGKSLGPNSTPGEKQVASEASEIIDRAIQQVRSMSHLLHPPLLDEVGLLSALSWYMEGLTKRSGIETSFEVQPDFPRLAPELETAIFRIVQEALTNVFKHSEARKVWINLSRRDSQTIVSVRDDGKGIKKRTADLQPDSIGIGLGGMRQRAKEFGGELRLCNAQPGTLVELVIPAGRSVSEETPTPA